MAQTADKLDMLAQQLSDVAQKIRNDPASLETSVKHKASLVGVGEAVLGLAKSPFDRLFESMAVMTQLTALRLFIKWDALELIPQNGTILYADLAAKLKADVGLISMFPYHIHHGNDILAPTT